MEHTRLNWGPWIAVSAVLMAGLVFAVAAPDIDGAPLKVPNAATERLFAGRVARAALLALTILVAGLGAWVLHVRVSLTSRWFRDMERALDEHGAGSSGNTARRQVMRNAKRESRMAIVATNLLLALCALATPGLIAASVVVFADAGVPEAGAPEPPSDALVGCVQSLKQCHEENACVPERRVVCGMCSAADTQPDNPVEAP